MQTVPTTASNGNTANDTTREQLLSLLGELTEKLEPTPAPRPESVTITDMNVLLPLLKERDALKDAVAEVRRAMTEISVEASALRRKIPAARNERAWGSVFNASQHGLDMMLEAVSYNLQATENYVRNIARMLVLAADGDPEAVAALQDGERHE